MMHMQSLIIFIIFLIGVICLQIFLSKKENKWLGLILPSLNLLFSVLISLLVVGESDSVIWQVFIAFLQINISTIILLIIYASCRDKVAKKNELEQMVIKDLR